MNNVECPVCGGRYRFDHSKMTKEKIGVKCRKCENSFVISRDMFRSSEAETSPPSYAFVGDFWVFGTRLEGLRRVVDLSKGRGISMLKDRRFEEMKRFFRSESHGMAYMDLRATSLLLRNLLTQGLVAGFFKSWGERGRDLQLFLQLLETLNYVWSQAEFEGEHVRFLVYAAL